MITNAYIDSAPKYILVIDHKAGTVPEEFTPLHYEILNKRDILGAMKEAEIKFWDSTVYMMEIAENTDVIFDNRLVYQTVLSSRSKGNFHLTDGMHYEKPFTVLYNDWTPGAKKIQFGYRCDD